MNCGGISNAQHSSVVVISPLNALIQDQILTTRKGTLNVCVLKGDRLNGDDDREEVKLNAPVGSLLSTTYDLICTYPEVVVDNKKVFKFIKNPIFIPKMKALLLWMIALHQMFKKHLFVSMLH